MRLGTKNNQSFEISVVVPIWNDVENVEPFVDLISQQIKLKTKKFEIIFCVDPSNDGTEKVIANICRVNKKVKAIFFASRAGQPASTLAGLQHAKGRAVIVLDVDLQDPIELIPKMIDEWRLGNLLVLPRRVSRSGEPITKKITAALGYYFLSRFGSAPIPKNTGDFRLMDHSIVTRVLSLREAHVFLRGLVALVDQNPKYIDFIRPPRKIGATKYNKWFGGIKSGLNGIVSFSTALLDWLIILGFLMAFFSFIIGAKFILYKLSGNYIPPGNAQLFAMVTFIGGMQLVGLGVLGLYVGRIFEEVKYRPRWLIANTLGIPDPDYNDTGRTGFPLER
jgi:glycosyltransferase involved in cell wall biosynthesis